MADHGFTAEEIVVIDAPYLSGASQGLRDAMAHLEAVVFADVCKQGQHPLASIITELQGESLLPVRWRCVAASPTYNPLGTTLTFTSETDVVRAALQVSPPACQ